MSFDEFIRNPLVSLFGGVFFSAIIAIIIYQVTRQKKLPIFNYSTRKLISNYKSEFEGLTVKYKNDDIESLYATKLVLWNKGKSSICSNDISINDPIRFNIDGKAIILDYGVIGKSDDSIIPNLTVSEDKRNLVIDFDHLNYKDGFAIQILHTENDDEFNVSGTLKCYKGKIGRSKNLFRLITNYELRYSIALLVSILGMAIGGMSAVIPYNSKMIVNDNPLTIETKIIIFGGVFVLALLGIVIKFRKYAKRRIPKELKKYV